MNLRRFVTIAVLATGVAACSDGTPQSQQQASAILPTIGTSGHIQANQPAKKLFGAKQVASPAASAAFGSYSKGCLAGSARLPETGPTWQAMRLSRNRNWAHPETVDYVQKLSAKAARQPGWNGLYVGDLSQPRGGPMLSGHASHQIGLDADIWLRPADNLTLSRSARENISSISMRRNAGAFVNDNWTPAHHEILKAAASDPRVARIFIFPGAKVQMCNDAKGDRSWLRKIRPWYGHHYHFHVRLACPDGAQGCIDQNPPPPGDGCADAQAWVNNILNPPPPDPNAPKPKPKREILLADLPAQCAAVLQ
ncbi:penicillin-insensitive murein endopeptidase [uncultured Roseobacter sp.]|uniref:penicillin-insensitive murein endopeptidase n=1 Tax=uncultured Roseobacter sp. TaxID=114847 RepID=UPI002614519A|nr:penicillin-insensitive murein endopeptidase [uncultured Roseobacter sp.]